MDVLIRIKGLIQRDRVRFSDKAQSEVVDSGLTQEDVLNSIMTASVIVKVMRSRSPSRRRMHEKLYVIHGLTRQGVLVYTKGTFRTEAGEEVFYVLVSAKKAVYWS